MKPQIISREEIIVEEGKESQVTRWYFSQDGIHEINLGNLLDERVSDCQWLDKEQTILLVCYSDWDSTEMVALVSPQGIVYRTGIYCIEEYFEDLGQTIISIKGYGLGSEGGYYGLAEDDQRMALLDWNGKFIIPPSYDHIYFDEEDNCFYAKNYGCELKAYSTTGERLSVTDPAV